MKLARLRTSRLGWAGLAFALATGWMLAQPVGSFTGARLVPGIPATDNWHLNPTVTEDGLTIIYFADGPHRLYQGRRSSVEQPFDVQLLGAAINSTGDGRQPALGASMTADGLVLVFTRALVGGYWGGPTLFEARRAGVDEPFGEATALPSAINQGGACTPDLSPDGKVLLFSSERSGGFGNEDIWAATRASLDDPFGGPVNANEFFPGSLINTPQTEIRPSLSSDGLTLFFSDHIEPRSGGVGGADLWVCSRPDRGSPFGPAINLNDFGFGSLVNRESWQGWPAISRDWPAPGSKIYYVSGETVGLWPEIAFGLQADLWEAEWVPYRPPRTRWTRMLPSRPNVPPPARYAAAMVYDEQRERVLMHGGESPTGPLNDTWEWDGESWALVSTSGPAVRYHGMAYDARRGVTVLYGGRNDAVGIQNLNETWEWDGQSWTKIDTGSEDPNLVMMTLVYDREREQVIRHGGVISGDLGNEDGATYGWDGSAWTPVAQGTHIRGGQAAVYDSDTGRTLTFGGSSDPGFRPAVSDNETWALDGAEWTLVSSDEGPAGRYFFDMAFDTRRGVAVVFGGWDYPGTTHFEDTWEWNGLAWNEADVEGSPGTRYRHAMAYDAKNGARWSSSVAGASISTLRPIA